MMILLLLPGAVRADHPLVAEDTATQGAGGSQLEVNAEWTRDAGVRGFQPAATLAYGLREKVDVQLTVPYLKIKDGDEGLLDTVLELKWRFYDEGALSFGLMPGITLPAGDETKGFGAGRATWGSLVIASYDQGRWGVNAHAGYRRDQGRHLWQLASALWWKASETLSVAIDFSADTNPDGERSLRQTVLGVIYAVSKDLDLDAGLRLGEPATERALLLGLTFRW